MLSSKRKHSHQLLVCCLLATSLLACGCRWIGNSVQLPSEKRFYDGQVVIYSELKLKKQQQTMDSLQLVRADLERKLGLPKASQPVSVYLFENPKRFDKYINRSHPEFPNRQAFFVKDGPSLIVYAAWSDEAAIDLRHEVTHGYLHSVLPSLPLWLDEGLAEYYEVEREQNGFNEAHAKFLYRRFAEGTWRPDLIALEQRQTSGEMLQIDYAEAWLWTHWILSTYREGLRSTDKNRCAQLATYLNRIAQDEEVPPYSELLGDLEAAQHDLINHLTLLTGRVRLKN